MVWHSFLFSVGEQVGVKEDTCEWSAMAKTFAGSPAMLFIPLCEKNQTFPNKDLWSLNFVSESVHLVSGFVKEQLLHYGAALQSCNRKLVFAVFAVHFKVFFIRFIFHTSSPTVQTCMRLFTAYPGVFETTSQDFCSHNRLLRETRSCAYMLCLVSVLLSS